MSEQEINSDQGQQVPADENKRDMFAWFRRSTKRSNTIIEYQPDALEIEERMLPGMTRWTLYTLLTLIAFAIIWSILSRVDSIIVAQGKLITTAPTLVVQPLETSVIRSVDVKVGEVVKKGQSLAKLDPTFTAADVAQLLQRQKSFAIQTERLEAELEGKKYQPTAKKSGKDQQLQLVIFSKRFSQYEARLRSLDEKIQQLNAGIRTQKRDRELLTSRYKVLQEAEKMRSTLEKEGHGSRIKLLDARNARLEVQRNLDLATNGLEEKSHEIASARAEKEAFIQEWRQKVAEELVGLQREKDAISEQLNKAQRRREMVQLTAPSDSVVLEAAGRSVGSVVREAEPLFTLVPLDVPLEAEASIEARDIGFVKVGDEVRIKFDAFPFQKHGTAIGTVRTISQDAFSNEGENPGPSFYKTRVTLNFDSMRNLPADFRFIPGMTIVAEIKVGDRNVISFITYPFIKGMDESLREP